MRIVALIFIAFVLLIPSATFAQGIITTVAGNGTRGFSGDGGPATSASLAQPADVAVDGAGNVYIADKLNNPIPVRRPAYRSRPPSMALRSS